ncbi:MAG: hypothetical protein E6J74_31545 [Deltaproteobacteria bacterium]|nr:MAG: hypothetical protein E6J74_31545 [Deltaproteobacteria bacterium]
MKLPSISLVGRALATLLLAALAIGMTNAAVFAASAALSKAQKEADAKGYIFVAAHEEIVSKAKQEGKVRVIVSTDGGLLKHLTAGFKKKYPFIDIRADELRGTDAYIRQLHEIKGGLVKGQDVNDLAYDYYDEYAPFQKKFDILGMAEQRVLQIPPQLVDAVNRNVVAIGSGIQVVAYNKKLIAAEKVPDTWEGFLKIFGRKISRRSCRRGVLKRHSISRVNWPRKIRSGREETPVCLPPCSLASKRCFWDRTLIPFCASWTKTKPTLSPISLSSRFPCD